jgi:hypothetical protein
MRAGFREGTGHSRCGELRKKEQKVITRPIYSGGVLVECQSTAEGPLEKRAARKRYHRSEWKLDRARNLLVLRRGAGSSF